MSNFKGKKFEYSTSGISLTDEYFKYILDKTSIDVFKRFIPDFDAKYAEYVRKKKDSLAKKGT